MSTENQITLIAASLAFLASIASIAVSLYSIRFKRFVFERWWERKADAYEHIINALSEMVEYYRLTYESGLGEIVLSEDEKAESQTKWRNYSEQVRKATNVGAYIIAEEAEQALRNLWKEPEKKIHPQDWILWIEHDYDAAETCLKLLVEEAKRDLKVKGF